MLPGAVAAAPRGAGRVVGRARAAVDAPLAVALVVAVALAPVVALVYWPQPAHLGDPLRVFSVAGVAIGLAVAIGLELLSRVRPLVPVFLVLGLVLLASSTTSALGQRAAWNRRSNLEESILGATIAALPDPTATTGIVVVDPEAISGSLYALLPAYFQIATEYLLPGHQSLAVCHQDAASILAAPPTATRTESTCSVEAGVLHTSVASVDLSTAVVVEIRRTTGSPSPYPSAWPSAAPRTSGVRRVDEILDCVAAGSCDEGGTGVVARVIDLDAPAEVTS